MSKKPKFITILMDDMGWTDLSYCGSNFYESHNLVDEMPEKAAELLALLHDWQNSIEVLMPERNSDYIPWER